MGGWVVGDEGPHCRVFFECFLLPSHPEGRVAIELKRDRCVEKQNVEKETYKSISTNFTQLLRRQIR